MLKRLTSASTALVFFAQSFLTAIPARPQSLAHQRPVELDTEPAGGRTAVLDAQRRTMSVGGLTVLLRDTHYAGGVLVHVTSVGLRDTPSLAIDRDIYGANARLLNLTTSPEDGCNSYRIASAALNIHPVSSTLTGSTSANEALAVSIHHAGVWPSEALKYPAVFVFNPVHGNWAEAKPFVPSAPEPQRVYATLSEPNQQIIGGVIALPESLQSEPARKPDPGNVWLAGALTGHPQIADKVLFARHQFSLSNGDDACMNFDNVLTSYRVETNPLYDGGNTVPSGREVEIALTSQTFNFTYEGQKNCEAGSSESIWPAPTDFGSLGELLKKAPGGQLGFPAGLLDNLGFGLLTSGSLLGTASHTSVINVERCPSCAL
jgi:hypothetical protein